MPPTNTRQGWGRGAFRHQEAAVPTSAYRCGGQGRGAAAKNLSWSLGMELGAPRAWSLALVTGLLVQRQLRSTPTINAPVILTVTMDSGVSLGSTPQQLQSAAGRRRYLTSLRPSVFIRKSNTSWGCCENGLDNAHTELSALRRHPLNDGSCDYRQFPNSGALALCLWALAQAVSMPGIPSYVFHR